MKLPQSQVLYSHAMESLECRCHNILLTHLDSLLRPHIPHCEVVDGIAKDSWVEASQELNIEIKLTLRSPRQSG